MHKPRSHMKHPLRLKDGSIHKETVFLNNVIHHPRIEIGDYSYYHDKNIPEDYARTLAPYLFETSPDKLMIGKFVQIAEGVKFITSNANHQFDGFSAFPFAVFGGAWAASYEPCYINKGDTRIGNDVWIGNGAVIMPGISIGDGAIVGTHAVVVKNVPPYTIVGGNPAKILRQRFEDKTIEALQKIAWWNWPIEVIEENIEHITGGCLDKLWAISESQNNILVFKGTAQANLDDTLHALRDERAIKLEGFK